MFNSADLYLGTFLVLCGFALSLLNLKRIMKNDSQFSSVLLSENIILMCIGIAFVSRSVYEMKPGNIDVMDVKKSAEIMAQEKYYMTKTCDFFTVLMSYGPLIVSLVNSFLSLIIDNYMHYKMIENMKEKDAENIVQEIGERERGRKMEVKKLFLFFKKYFSFIAIALQWIVPILMVLSMYPMGVKEMTIPITDLHRASDSCVAMLDINNETCSLVNNSTILEFRKYIPSNYLEVYDNLNVQNNTEINSVINNIYKIVANVKNNTKNYNINITSPYIFRKSKLDAKCMKMCYLENRKIILYIVLFAIVSYFVPVTISTILLTKIHIIDTKKPNIKTYVSRELLYNILFWTPVMFDTFLSLILCSYSMSGMRTSLFNVIANIYQAVKNFMNTKHFKESTVVPV